ncbi:carboxypeptidase-like regulatory domain-containing protein [Phormidesmis priestleyi]
MPSPSVEEIRHHVAIAGSLTDATSGRAIAGAIVEIVDPALQTLTREDGGFYFIDLPVGLYSLNVSAPSFNTRYGVVTGLTIAVQNTVEGRPIFDSKARVKLTPTALVGRVTRADNNQPIERAIVQLRWTTIQTLTDQEGRYTLSGLLSSASTVQASAKGFSTSIQKVVLTTGQETTANLSLSVTP